MRANRGVSLALPSTCAAASAQQEVGLSVLLERVCIKVDGWDAGQECVGYGAPFEISIPWLGGYVVAN